MSRSYVVIVRSYNFWGKSWFIKAKPNSRFWKVWNALDLVVQDTKQGLCNVWNHVSHVGLELKSENIKSWKFFLKVNYHKTVSGLSSNGEHCPLTKTAKEVSSCFEEGSVRVPACRSKDGQPVQHGSQCCCQEGKNQTRKYYVMSWITKANQ